MLLSQSSLQLCLRDLKISVSNPEPQLASLALHLMQLRAEIVFSAFYFFRELFKTNLFLFDSNLKDKISKLYSTWCQSQIEDSM